MTSSDLIANLRSSDPARITVALEELDDRRRTGREVALEFPGVEVFGIPEDVSDRQLELLLRLVLDYDSFDPPLTWLQRIQLATEALVQYGGGQSTFHVALAFQLGIDPVGAVREAIHYLWVRGFNSQTERAAAARLFGDFLDVPSLRPTVLEGLRPWSHYPEMAGVVHDILPQLDETESAFLLDPDE